MRKPRHTARRSALLHTRRPPPGASPGTLIADPHALRPAIRVIAYGADGVDERSVPDAAEARALVGRYPVTWINVDGLRDVDLLRAFGEAFDIHDLALEDVINVHQRSKVEEYDANTFIVTRIPVARDHADSEQISLFLGDGWLLTFQERPGDCFDPVRVRIRTARGRIREGGADYLVYALIDAAIDAYYPVLEDYGEQIETLENILADASGPNVISEIHDTRRSLLNLRRVIWPQREMVNALLRDTSPRIGPETAVYLRDCYDHTFQLLDIVETYRDIASGLVELHLSAVSNRLNEIMKVLTIMATIFIPLGFIAGVYGMNFDRQASPLNMPELGWYWGYPFALALMGAVAAGLLLYFQFRGWMGGRRRQVPPPGHPNT